MIVDKTSTILRLASIYILFKAFCIILDKSLFFVLWNEKFSEIYSSLTIILNWFFLVFFLLKSTFLKKSEKI